VAAKAVAIIGEAIRASCESATPNDVHAPKEPSRRHHERYKDEGDPPDQPTPHINLAAEVG
jgi:hypothetical protein